MKGDFTRSTFNPKKHYSGVLMQQGRVQLDADWNEQVGIEKHRDRTTTGDVVGATGVPVLPDGTSSGFKIQLPNLGQIEPGMRILQGRIYVDGILCENDATIDYALQADYPGAPTATAGLHLVYLDVWERHITPLHDPNLREVALGGPDTATRTKVVWQVKLLKITNGGANPTCATEFPEWDTLVASPGGKMKAQTRPAAPGDTVDPCIVPPAAGYRGLENQHYRVEIHSVAGNVITYKWSRDNGAFAYDVEGLELPTAATAVITVASLGRDQYSGLRVNDWVEVIDEQNELAGKAGALAKITAIDAVDRRVTVTLATSGALANYSLTGAGVVVRRWDFAGAAPPTVTLAAGATSAWLPLEHGVEVQFIADAQGAASSFRTGDYWQIPARTVTADIEWPRTAGVPDALFARGIRHHYCRLALASHNGTGWDRLTLKDCRPTFLSLSKIPTLQFHYVGGDGQEGAPGGTLDRLLEVSVIERGRRISGAKVKFKVMIGNGTVTSGGTTANEVVAETDVNGVASCSFTLDNTNTSQQVEALLLDEQGITRNYNPIHFNASFNSSGIDFHYVGGDGQEASPSGTLPRLLQVGVNDRGRVKAGSKVRYRVTIGTGTLKATRLVNGVPTEFTGTSVITETGSDGIASASFQLDGLSQSQQVEAQLLNNAEELENLTPIRFNATISAERAFLYVSGDGQETMPGGNIPMPLQVAVVDGETRKQGARVKFRVKIGGGKLSIGSGTQAVEVIAVTDVNGVASANWKLDALTPVQQVEAILLGVNDEPTRHEPIRFNGNLSTANAVAYTPPSACDKFEGVTTVQQALDALCACDCGPDCPPVIRIIGIHLGTEAGTLGPAIDPYATLTLDSLEHGIMVVTDTDVDPVSVKPCSVYGDMSLPYPLIDEDRSLWSLTPISGGVPLGSQIVGYQPVTMAANVGVAIQDNKVIRWTPTETMRNAMQNWLDLSFFPESYPVAVKLQLKGSSIWSETNPEMVLAGATRYSGNTVKFPTGEGCDHGSDFIFCFHIVKNPSQSDPCERVISVTFPTSVIAGNNVSGTLVFERPPTRQYALKFVSNSNSVIPTDQPVVINGATGNQQTAYPFTLATTADSITNPTSVTVTLESQNADDPCKQGNTGVVTVNPEPCDKLTTIEFPNPAVIGSSLVGRMFFAGDDTEARNVTFSASTHPNLVPVPKIIAVPANVSSHQFFLPTDAAHANEVQERTEVTLTVQDPCNGTRTFKAYVDPKPCQEIVQVTNTSVVGGNPTEVTFKLSAPSSEARTYTVTSNKPAVIENNVSATIDPGEQEVTFSLDTFPVDVDTDVIITTTSCGQTISHTIRVQKRPCENLYSLEFDDVIGGEDLIGHIRFVTAVAEDRTIDFISLDDSAIPDGQAISVAEGAGATAVQFTLETLPIAEYRSVPVEVVICGVRTRVHVNVHPVPCEPIIEVFVAESNYVVGGMTLNGHVRLQEPSYTANLPVNVISSNPEIIANFQVPMGANVQQNIFSRPVQTVAVEKQVTLTFVRCGEEYPIMVTVRPEPVELAKIGTGTITSVEHPATEIDVRNPGEIVNVNVYQMSGEGEHAFTMRIKFDLCDLEVDPATVNPSTFFVRNLGGEVVGQGSPVPGFVETDGTSIWCDIPSEALPVGNNFKVTVKGSAPGPVIMSLAGTPLDGEFTRVLDGTNCSGNGTGGGDFVFLFRTIYNVNVGPEG